MYGDDTLNGYEKKIKICGRRSLRITNRLYRHQDILKYPSTETTKNLRVEYPITTIETSIKVTNVPVEKKLNVNPTTN